MLGSIGMPELILILVIALIVFGPKKLPEIGKSLGKGLAEFKKASDDLKHSIQKEVESLEHQAKTEPPARTETQARLDSPAAAEPSAVPPTDKIV